MVFALLTLLVALAIGWLRGGSLEGLSGLRLRLARLVIAALLVQLIGGLAGGWRYPVGLALSAVLVAVFLALNRQVQGVGLIALGLFLNALVVGVNGAMPVSDDALGRAGISSQDIISGADPRHQLAGPSTHLELISDVIPVLLPGHAEIVSAGDVLVAAGLGQLVVVGMGRRRPAPLTSAEVVPSAAAPERDVTARLPAEAVATGRFPAEPVATCARGRVFNGFCRRVRRTGSPWPGPAPSPTYPRLCASKWSPPSWARGGRSASCGTLVRRGREETTMAKKGRKRRARKKSNANHGKRPNA